MRDRDLARSSRQTSTDTASLSLSIDGSRPVTHPPDNLADDMGKLRIIDDQAVYTGSSHWVTILEDVSLRSAKQSFVWMEDLIVISPDQTT